MQLSIIVPVYNNSKTLDELIRRINSSLAPRQMAYEVLLINDGSKDESWPIIRNICASHPNIVAINFARNFGQMAGIRAGLSYARGELLVLMDADLEDRPEHIPLLLDALKPELDAVFTAVNLDRQRKTSRLFHWLADRMMDSETLKGIGTFRLFTRKFANALLRFTERRPVWGPLMHGLGFRHAVVQLPDGDPRGNSGYSRKKRAQLALDFVVANTSLPFFIIFLFALFLFVATIAYAGVIVIRSLFFDEYTPSGLSLLAFLIVSMFGCNFLFISVIGLYMNRLMIESLNRPLFVVSDVVNADYEILTDKD